MALARKTQKLFAGDVTPTGNVAQFGSLKAGSPAYSADPAVIQALAAFGQGWSGAVVGTNSPARADMNALFYTAFYQLAYLFQSGIAEWDSATAYDINSIARNGAQAYRSLQAANTGHAVTDTNWWTPWPSVPTVDAQTLARGWVVFNSSGTVLRAFNATVSKTAAGYYTVNWTTPMPSSTYAVVATCGGTTTGRNNYISISDQPSAMTASSVKLRENKDGEDDTAASESTYISVVAYA